MQLCMIFVLSDVWFTDTELEKFFLKAEIYKMTQKKASFIKFNNVENLLLRIFC